MRDTLIEQFTCTLDQYIMAKSTKKFLASLASKSVTELRDMLRESQKELYFLQMKNKVRALSQTHLLSAKKKEIARISTLLTSMTKVA